MKTITFFRLAIIVFIASCKKIDNEKIRFIESIKLSPKSVEADNSSLVNMEIRINKDADISKRKLLLETSAGTFLGTGLKTATIDAVFEGGELIGRAKLKAPSSPGTMLVTVKPESRYRYNDFIVVDSVQALPSVVSSISVAASAFGVQTGFVGEVLITGTLKNSNGKNVSSGAKVAFSDFYLNGGPVSGRFRQMQTNSDENSKVTAYYSPGLIPPGTSINVRITVLDASGNPTLISNSVLLTVTP